MTMTTSHLTDDDNTKLN